MTNLKRVMVSLPRDLEAEIDELRKRPEFERLPASRILCRLIRRGLEDYKGDLSWIDE
ncbi:MAG: hypothetical protein IJR48_04025 [Oscillibacter sp.]|nr:hypothetical protein [Oscillibacter sp.]MBQ7681133.1 hypothetical protein [Oscillibacter sp.]MBQ9617512.1 hypothetical protein [Oscillibacter sp.]